AKTRSAVAPRMVQPADRNECGAALFDHRGERVQRAADDVRRRLVDPRICRRIARIEISAAALRKLDHEVDVLRGMEVLDLGARRFTRAPPLDARRGRGAVELSDERIVPVGAERMTVRKTVRRDLGPGDDDHCPAALTETAGAKSRAARPHGTSARISALTPFPWPAGKRVSSPWAAARWFAFTWFAFIPRLPIIAAPDRLASAFSQELHGTVHLYHEP